MTIKKTGGIFGRNPTFNEITIDGAITANGNIVMADGKGIDFSATSGTGTSELFGDYEEGTWSPTYEGSTTAGSATYSRQSGIYTKIGNMVFCNFTLGISAHGGSPAGTAQIGGLPFTSANTSANYSSLVINFNIGHAYSSGYQLTGWVSPNSTKARLWEFTNTGVGNGVALDSSFAEINVSLSYRTA
tara:strand:+ start:52 stop:615 length:564 start_codon:yes stop_codon:yes gene_type:complete